MIDSDDERKIAEELFRKGLIASPDHGIVDLENGYQEKMYRRLFPQDSGLKLVAKGDVNFDDLFLEGSCYSVVVIDSVPGNLKM